MTSGNSTRDVQIPVLTRADSGTGVPSPSDAQGEVHVWREHGQICAYGYAAEGDDWMRVPDIATFRLGQEIIAFADPATSTSSITRAFERSVLPMAIQALGGNALHASGVVGPSGVVAFSGESGSGKSTAAHALGLRGYPLWADDAVAFEFANGVCTTTRLPFEVKLRPDAAIRAASTGAAPSAPERTAPLVGIVVLRRESTAALTAQRLEGVEAFRSVLEQAYCFRPDMPYPSPSMVDAYLNLVAQVPVMEIHNTLDWQTFEEMLDNLAEIVETA